MRINDYFIGFSESYIYIGLISAQLKFVQILMSRTILRVWLLIIRLIRLSVPRRKTRSNAIDSGRKTRKCQLEKVQPRPKSSLGLKGIPP